MIAQFFVFFITRTGLCYGKYLRFLQPIGVDRLNRYVKCPWAFSRTPWLLYYISWAHVFFSSSFHYNISMFQVRAQKEYQLCPMERWLLIICHFDKWIYLVGPSCVIVLLDQHYWSRTRSRRTWQKDELYLKMQSLTPFYNYYMNWADNFNAIRFYFRIEIHRTRIFFLNLPSR